MIREHLAVGSKVDPVDDDENLAIRALVSAEAMETVRRCLGNSNDTVRWAPNGSVDCHEENASNGKINDAPDGHVVLRSGVVHDSASRGIESGCALCGSAKVRTAIRDRHFTIGYCDRCQSGMVIDLPDSDDRNDVADDHGESYSQRYENERLRDKANVCWDTLLDRTDDLANVESILDIGCGHGSFLNMARRSGLRTAGIEISLDAAVEAVSCGHEVLHGSIMKSRFPADAQFDVITMWDVLEHLDRPIDALRNAVSMLAPGGRLLIVTPMMGSVFDRLGLLMYRVSGGRLNQLVRMCWSEEHLFRFHPRGLAGVLQSLGCRNLSTSKMQLLSLRSDRYAGGAILPNWTPSTRLNQLLSKSGVGLARVFRLRNKVLVDAVRNTENA